MEQANNQGAKWVVYVDGDKAPEGQFEFKNLATGELGTGTPETIAKIISQ
jgi:histidyl-tRNA synthetase